MPTFTFQKPIEDVEEPILLEEGWERARIVVIPTIEPNNKKKADPEQDGAGDNLVVSVMLTEGDANGRRFKLHLPWPGPGDEDKYDGIGKKVSDGKMERIADFTIKFGGVSEGTDIVLEENMEGYIYITQGLDQQGQDIINQVDTFGAGFQSIEEMEAVATGDPEGSD